MHGTIVPEDVALTPVVMHAGASVASYILQPKASISLGASGAVFGLFAVSVLCKISFNLKKLIECGILGQFVIQQLLQVGLVSDVQHLPYMCSDSCVHLGLPAAALLPSLHPGLPLGFHVWEHMPVLHL